MAKFDPFLSLDCARVKGVGAQSKERKGSNFVIWLPWEKESEAKRLESKLGDVGGRLEGERSRAEKLEVAVREREQGRRHLGHIQKCCETYIKMFW